MRFHRHGLLVLAAAAACASPAEAPPVGSSVASTAVTTTTSTTTTTTLPLPYPEPLVWAPCGDGLECGSVTVPVDYAAPSRASLDLALVRRPARDPARRIGSLLVNPGGPGASGVRRVARGFEVSEEVGERFDIVGFDPRGVGQSQPVACGDAVAGYRAADLAPDTPEEQDELEAAARALADACRRSEAGRLAHLGTVNVARDVEMIRRALGEEPVSFVGLSYGTLVGQLWVDAHPASVRALVLDGAVGPGTTGATSSVAQAQAVESTVAAIDRACTVESACPVAATGFLAAYDELAGQVEAGTGAGAGVGPTQLAYAAFYATYDDDTWPRLWQAVAAGLDGDLAPIGVLAASYTRLVDYAPFAIVSCLDGPHPSGVDAWLRAGDAVEAASPRFGRHLANELLPCAFWPQGEPMPGEIQARDAPPILVVASTGDAATPYDAGVGVADALSTGHLLSVDLAGHVAIGDSPCATEAVTRYLVDLVVPAAGTRC